MVPRYWEHLWKHSFTDRWSLEWEIEQICFAGCNWSTWSILAVGSGIHPGSILRVLAVFPDSICSGYSGYCNASISDFCTAGAVYVLGLLYTAHHVRSTRRFWAFSTADTLSTRSINLEHHNNRVPQYSQYQQYSEYRTKKYSTSSMYREKYPLSPDRYS